MLQIGIIGYGAIGRDVSRYIAENRAGNAAVRGILVRDRNRAEAHLAENIDADKLFDSPAEFFAMHYDVVVEAAGHAAVQSYGEQILAGGSDLIVTSVGAFADQELYERVLGAAERSSRRLIIPSCAIAGLDRIAAAGFGPIDHVTLTTRKPVNAWRGTLVEEKYDLDSLSEPVCVFEGPAREAARLFPESVNVSAALSIAGIGFDKTTVRVFADPTLTRNTHEVSAAGKFGEVFFQIRNTPSHNPKTGWIVAMSVAKAIKNLSSPLWIGI